MWPNLSTFSLFFWYFFQYWPLIGQYRSRDLNTGVWLVNTGHVTLILEYCSLINTGLWLVNTGRVTLILACDWSTQVTWPEYWPVIGQYKSRDLNTGLLLVLLLSHTPAMIHLWATSDHPQAIETLTGQFLCLLRYPRIVRGSSN